MPFARQRLVEEEMIRLLDAQPQPLGLAVEPDAEAALDDLVHFVTSPRGCGRFAAWPL